MAELHRLTSAIPIIFTQTSEPVESGIVASLARPGGNMTGFQNFEPAIGGKWLEILKEVAPGLKDAGAVFSRDAAAHAQFLRSAQNVAPSLGMTVTVVDIQGDLERAITAYAEQPDRGLLVFPHPRTIANRRLIASLALRQGTPAIYPYRYFADDGGLITTGRTRSINGGARRSISIAFSKVRSPPSCRCRRRRSMSWQSTLKWRRPSG